MFHCCGFKQVLSFLFHGCFLSFSSFSLLRAQRDGNLVAILSQVGEKPAHTREHRSACARREERPRGAQESNKPHTNR